MSVDQFERGLPGDMVHDHKLVKIGADIGAQVTPRAVIIPDDDLFKRSGGTVLNSGHTAREFDRGSLKVSLSQLLGNCAAFDLVQA